MKVSIDVTLKLGSTTGRRLRFHIENNGARGESTNGVDDLNNVGSHIARMDVPIWNPHHFVSL